MTNFFTDVLGTASDAVNALAGLPGSILGGSDDLIPDVIKKWQAAARQTEYKYNLPAGLVTNLITHESGWNPAATNPKSGAAGLGQFLESTARSMGTSTDELKKNPMLAIDLVGRLLRQNIDHYQGDVDKGVAAYYQGNDVDEAVKMADAHPGTSWLDALDALGQKKYGHTPGKDTASAWMNAIQYKPSIGGVSRQMAGGGPYGGGQGAGGTSTGVGSIDQGLVPPKLDDYLNDPTYSNPSAARQAYNKAYDEYQLYQAGGSKGQLYDVYLKNIIAEMGNQIAAGNLSVNAASKRFSDLLESAKFGQDQYNSESFKYGAPLGATSIHGPYSDIPIQGATVLNPMQRALGLEKQVPDYLALAQSFMPNYSDLNSKIQAGLGATSIGQPPPSFSAQNLPGWGVNMLSNFQGMIPGTVGAIQVPLPAINPSNPEERQMPVMNF